MHQFADIILKLVCLTERKQIFYKNFLNELEK